MVTAYKYPSPPIMQTSPSEESPEIEAKKNREKNDEVCCCTDAGPDDGLRDECRGEASVSNFYF